MGPSGSGKSTLLHLAAGSTGRRRAASRSPAGVAAACDDELSELRRNAVGFVFQFFNLLPTLSARENVALPCCSRERRPPRAARGRVELLERVGLGDRVEHRPAEAVGRRAAAGGDRARAGHEPPCSLADEPTGNLDRAAGDQVLDLLASLVADGATLVMVTHSAEAAARAQRVVQIRDGRVEADDLVTRPATSPPSGTDPARAPHPPAGDRRAAVPDARHRGDGRRVQRAGGLGGRARHLGVGDRRPGRRPGRRRRRPRGRPGVQRRHGAGRRGRRGGRRSGRGGGRPHDPVHGHGRRHRPPGRRRRRGPPLPAARPRHRPHGRGDLPDGRAGDRERVDLGRPRRRPRRWRGPAAGVGCVRHHGDTGAGERSVLSAAREWRRPHRWGRLGPSGSGGSGTTGAPAPEGEPAGGVAPALGPRHGRPPGRAETAGKTQRPALSQRCS